MYPNPKPNNTVAKMSESGILAKNIAATPITANKRPPLKCGCFKTKTVVKTQQRKMANQSPNFRLKLVASLHDAAKAAMQRTKVTFANSEG